MRNGHINQSVSKSISISADRQLSAAAAKGGVAGGANQESSHTASSRRACR
jgi:hypothetical protein